MCRFALVMALLGAFSFLGVEAYPAEEQGAPMSTRVYTAAANTDATNAIYQEVWWPHHHHHWSGYWGYRPYYGYRAYRPYYSYYPYYGGYYSYYPYSNYPYYGYSSPGVTVAVPGFGLALRY